MANSILVLVCVEEEDSHSKTGSQRGSSPIRAFVPFKMYFLHDLKASHCFHHGLISRGMALWETQSSHRHTIRVSLFWITLLLSAATDKWILYDITLAQHRASCYWDFCVGIWHAFPVCLTIRSVPCALGYHRAAEETGKIPSSVSMDAIWKMVQWQLFPIVLNL